MEKNPVEILERLLAQEKGSRNTCQLKKSRDFWEKNWTYEEVAAIEAEFARDFRAVAAQVEATWGPPEFIGHRSKSKFPGLSFAEDLCYWRKGDRLAMIWWEHQDKEVPVAITLAVEWPEDIGGDPEI
jgi:hypothetical protein